MATTTTTTTTTTISGAAEFFYRNTSAMRSETSFFSTSAYPMELLLRFMTHFGRRQCCVTSFDIVRGVDYDWIEADKMPDSPSEWRDLLRRHGAALHFGLILREVLTVPVAGFRVAPPDVRVRVQRELVFDIDLRDKPERVALCRCSPLQACRVCWLLAEMAVAIFRHWLTEQCGFGRPLVVYSGGKGLHVWFGNERARLLSGECRRTLANILRSGAVPPPMTADGRAAPRWTAFMDAVLMPLFIERGLRERRLWDGDNGATTTTTTTTLFGRHVRAVLGADVAEKAERSATATTGVARWAALCALEPAQRVRDLVWQLAWPVLDASVLDQRSHMIKAPFSLHHTTLRLALPLDAAGVRECDPATMPRLPIQPEHAPVMERSRLEFESWLIACGYETGGVINL